MLAPLGNNGHRFGIASLGHARTGGWGTLARLRDTRETSQTRSHELSAPAATQLAVATCRAGVKNLPKATPKAGRSIQREKIRGHLKKELEKVAKAIAKAKIGPRKAAKLRKEQAKLSEKLNALD
jgi:hypothetical protein